MYWLDQCRLPYNMYTIYSTEESSAMLLGELLCFNVYAVMRQQLNSRKESCLLQRLIRDSSVSI